MKPTGLPRYTDEVDCGLRQINYNYATHDDSEQPELLRGSDHESEFVCTAPSSSISDQYILGQLEPAIRHFDQVFESAASGARTLFRNGLPAKEFWDLFVQCLDCQHIMPRFLSPFRHPCCKKAAKRKVSELCETLFDDPLTSDPPSSPPGTDQCEKGYEPDTDDSDSSPSRKRRCLSLDFAQLTDEEQRE